MAGSSFPQLCAGIPGIVELRVDADIALSPAVSLVKYRVEMGFAPFGIRRIGRLVLGHSHP